MRTEAAVKVVLAESGQAVGGTERVVWELATRLPRERFDVRVWLSDVPAVDPFADALAARDVPVRRVAEVDSRWDFRGMIRTWRALRRDPPALLHVHHVWPASDRYLASLADAAGIEHLVVTEHIEGEPHSPAQTALKRGELARADAVTAVSAAVADSLVRDYRADRARIRLVPNGADPPPADEALAARRLRIELGASLTRPLWACVGRLEKQKGQDVLLDALALVRDAGLEFVVALAGEGTMRKSLETRVARLGLGERVRFLGRLDDAGALLAASDLVVMPSRWEGQPIVLVEAMMRGRAVVASAVGGIPEVLEDDVHGRLVPPTDAPVLARVLADLHHRGDLVARYGRAGGARAAQDYTWTRVVQQYEAVYDEVLGLASFAPAPHGRHGQAVRR
ncbi:MAG TPA: glycosyltransferase family 4 protein [Candidatus Eisenbacteria bacterium]|nr:glycosyltransferase family 4 protein [Candidatus Eisenbacteria bacterium]